ncbi:hypothetical protein GCM10023340_23330 [Nocardioides marinquilinus]|uniref:Secreted protein n=1 Tax=Nocardioides marinquilinus TaxID=1210400 RepID=A0ABP9PN89_9ACTN
MTPTARRRPSASLVVASLALVVAMGGTGYAAGVANNSVGTAQLKNDAVTSAKIKNDTIVGADVKESSLARVPDAAKVGGVGLNGLLRTQGCQRGKLLGFVRVNGDGAALTSAYGTTGLEIPYSCTGGQVEARRASQGRHLVRFVGNPAAFAFTQVRFDADGADEAACSTVKRVQGGPDDGAFSVTTFDCSTDAVVDVDFTILLP